MAEAVVSVVLETLGGLLQEEAGFLSGVSGEVKEISRELNRMLCFLKDADSKQSKDETIQNWLREIRSLAYRIEDLVETYAIQVATRKSTSAIKKFLKRFACIFGEIRSLHKLGTEIQKVKSDISHFTSSLQRYDIKAISNGGEGESSSSNQNQQWLRQTYAHEVEEYFVGMENNIKSLVSLLTEDDDKEHHRIISIWGMGGLGKTTLARKVYKHEDVQRHFERFAWTCITQQAQIEVILRDILKQLLPDEKKDGVKSMEQRELVRELHKAQTGRKCLVVLDDIWKLDDWKSILAAFPLAEGNIKVLMTTRKREVAEIGLLHELDCLNQMEGWELLQKKVSSNGRTDFMIAPCFKDVGMEMVSKCGGLPLAISVLGGILRDKNSLADWEMVNMNITSYLNNMDENGESTVNRVLSLSYHELPYHLKLCFLCFGHFKEYQYAQDLYLLWISEGLVLSQHQGNGGTLLEVAERYLHELVRRSMVQLTETIPHKSCGLHDLMRDLCLKKCREEEFIEVVDLQDVKQLGREFSYTNSVAYRLVIHINDGGSGATKTRINITQDDWKQIRSLHLSSSFSEPPSATWPQGTVMQNLPMLRVLRFQNFNFGKQSLPLELRRLTHLRILSFSNCILDKLPSSIVDLPLLRTLDLRGVANEIIIPNVLCKMKQLRHLYLSNHRADKGKMRLHGLRELETLDGLDSDVDEIEDLSEILVNLRVLGAVVDDDASLYALMECIIMNGQNLSKLELTIGDCDFISSEKGYDVLINILTCGSLDCLFMESKLVEFPSYEHGLLRVLTQLQLGGCKLEEDPMEALGQLPQLQSLALATDSYLGEYLICHELGFPQLRNLIFCGLPNLEYWRVDERSMSNLFYLYLLDCKSLVMVPYGLKFVEGLKYLMVKKMSTEFCERITVKNGQEGDDYYKIQHVPSISYI